MQRTENQDRILTVTQLCHALRRAIRQAMPGAVTVRGEIANCSRQPSGHMYLTLRDASSAVRCVMFRSANRLLRFSADNGVQVEARGELTVYTPRGDVQLVIEEMHPAGLGAQMAALEALKERLAAEGLLAPERKRPIPRLPQRVGVVTSPRGAAVRDVLEILAQRAPGIPVVVSPTIVQGDRSELAIAGAIERLGGSGLVDVIIVARGGGSLEDLWSFNTEPVARAIARCPVPVVSGVGHETDVTIADLVADERAATPSHAAQLVVPDMVELLHRVEALQRRLTHVAGRRVDDERRRLERLAGSAALRRPERLLAPSRQRIDDAVVRLERALSRRTERAAQLVSGLPRRLSQALGHRHRETAQALEVARRGLARAGGRRLPELAARLEGLEGRLMALGPRQVLGRGYVLARRTGGDGPVVTRAADLDAGERLRLEWIDGWAASTVDTVELRSDDHLRPGGEGRTDGSEEQRESGPR